jgi:predicted Rossmann fold nucleotide-binding protein DprA/Smf involved in DNA uptake
MSNDHYAPPVDYGPLFRTTDPATSKAAGVAAREFKGDHERRILEALAAGPAGKCEIARRCGLTEQQVNRRLATMRRDGAVERTGRVVTSDSGCGEHEYESKKGMPASL